MAQSKASDRTQCAARTASGDRCSRQATNGDYCYQHKDTQATATTASTADPDGHATSQDPETDDSTTAGEGDSLEWSVEPISITDSLRSILDDATTELHSATARGKETVSEASQNARVTAERAYDRGSDRLATVMDTARTEGRRRLDALNATAADGHASARRFRGRVTDVVMADREAASGLQTVLPTAQHGVRGRGAEDPDWDAIIDVIYDQGLSWVDVDFDPADDHADEAAAPGSESDVSNDLLMAYADLETHQVDTLADTLDLHSDDVRDHLTELKRLGLLEALPVGIDPAPVRLTETGFSVAHERELLEHRRRATMALLLFTLVVTATMLILIALAVL